MLRPTDIEKLKGDKSRYAIVIGVAKRAREIADRADQEGIELLEKPVSLAINDLTEGNYKILVSNADEETDSTETDR